MKISMPIDYKSYFTLDDLTAVKCVKKHIKDLSLEDAAQIIANGLRGKLVKAECTFSRDTTIVDALCDASGHINIWFDLLVNTDAGYTEIGIALTEIWKISADNFDDITHSRKVFMRNAFYS